MPVLYSFPFYWDGNVTLGSGVIANLENAGRIANSMTNIVSGSNIGRGLSADGGSNMHGVASRINLTGKLNFQI